MKFIEWFRQLERSRQIGFIAGIAAIVLLTLFVAWLTLWRPVYVPLSEIQGVEDGSVQARLDDLGIDYRVASGTGSVLVREERRDEIRAALASSSSFREPKGFEIFDNSDFGMTEFSQRINYERGLEGELTRTIMALDGIRYARIHLVLPEESLFQHSADEPKASVTLLVQKGKKVSPEQIAGIRDLIASSVPRLKPDRVSIHDHQGVDLASGVQEEKEPTAAAIESRMQSKEAVEAYITSKIYDVLSPIFPASSVVVSVDASLRLDHVSSTHDETLPKLGPAWPSRPRAGDGPVTHDATHAASSNMPSTASPAASGSALSGADYGTDKIHEQTDEVPGKIERLTVSIIVPQSDTALPNDALYDLVAGAVGIDQARGDVVMIENAAVRAATSTGAGNAAASSAKPTGGDDKRSDTAYSSVLEWVILILAFGFLALLGGIIWNKTQVDRLSEEERQLLLARVRTWLRDYPSQGEPAP